MLFILSNILSQNDYYINPSDDEDDDDNDEKIQHQRELVIGLFIWNSILTVAFFLHVAYACHRSRVSI